jgi:hypothetical protein
VAELAGKFALQEKDDKEAIKATRETRGTALKLSKVLQLMDSDHADELEQDEEVAMMTKMVRKFLKSKNSKQGTTPNKDYRDYTCYNCQEKGHLAKTCTKPKVDPPASNTKRAFVTTWGDSDEDSEDPKGKCLMTKPDEESEEAVEVSSIKLNILPKADLIIMVNGLIDDNNVLTGHLEDLEKENSDLLDESKELSKRLHAKEVAPITANCSQCKGKHIKSTSDNMTNSKIDLILDKLSILIKSINEKTVNQTVFL